MPGVSACPYAPSRPTHDVNAWGRTRRRRCERITACRYKNQLTSRGRCSTCHGGQPSRWPGIPTVKAGSPSAPFSPDGTQSIVGRGRNQRFETMSPCGLLCSCRDGSVGRGFQPARTAHATACSTRPCIRVLMCLGAGRRGARRPTSFRCVRPDLARDRAVAPAQRRGAASMAESHRPADRTTRRVARGAAVPQHERSPGSEQWRQRRRNRRTHRAVARRLGSTDRLPRHRRTKPWSRSGKSANRTRKVEPQPGHSRGTRVRHPPTPQTLPVLINISGALLEGGPMRGGVSVGDNGVPAAAGIPRRAGPTAGRFQATSCPPAR